MAAGNITSGEPTPSGRADLRRSNTMVLRPQAHGNRSLAAADRKYTHENARLLALVLAIAFLQFFVAPFAVPLTVPSGVALIVLCMITTPLQWGLMHESIHGNLFAGSANRGAGRLLGIFLCLSWEVMRFGHLLHHSNNRHEFDRPEAIPQGSSRTRAAVTYFAKLLGGHALISAVSSLGLALPSVVIRRFVPPAEPMRTAALRVFTNPEKQRRIRADVGAVVVL